MRKKEPSQHISKLNKEMTTINQYGTKMFKSYEKKFRLPIAVVLASQNWSIRLGMAILLETIAILDFALYNNYKEDLNSTQLFGIYLFAILFILIGILKLLSMIGKRYITAFVAQILTLFLGLQSFPMRPIWYLSEGASGIFLFVGFLYLFISILQIVLELTYAYKKGRRKHLDIWEKVETITKGGKKMMETVTRGLVALDTIALDIGAVEKGDIMDTGNIYTNIPIGLHTQPQLLDLVKKNIIKISYLERRICHLEIDILGQVFQDKFVLYKG